MNLFTDLDVASPKINYMNELLLNEFDKKIKKDNVDSCLILQDGALVYKYFRNNKMRVKQHKINSVTKSVLSALIGIALNKGLIESVHVPIVHYFPELKRPGVDKRKLEITVLHLLTMTAGLQWTSNKEMESSKNWVRYILERPMEQQPGIAMNYCCGYSHLLSAILSKTSGMDASTFAQKFLFGPLDIKDYRWPSDAQGISNGGFGLAMQTVDMLKIGYLYLNNGRWFSKQILPESWVKDSTTARLNSYGCHWWVLSGKADTPKVYYAQGYGGNNIIIVPDYQLITVFTGAIFEDSSRPFRLFNELILPAVMNINQA